MVMPFTRYVSGDWNAICSKCNLELSSENFYFHSNGKPRKVCKKCHLSKAQEWASNNKEKRNLHAKKSREKNKEKQLEATRNWRKNNLKYDAYRAATYRNTKQKQTPKWANLDKIKDIYLNCPDGYHVDHIVPLRGKTVSGLHVEDNLQYLPAKENLKKRNFYGDAQN